LLAVAAAGAAYYLVFEEAIWDAALAASGFGVLAGMVGIAVSARTGMGWLLGAAGAGLSGGMAVLAAWGLTHADEAPPGEAERARTKLEGTWELVAMQTGGTEKPRPGSGEGLVIDRGRIRFQEKSAAPPLEAAYQTHPDRKPPAIDLTWLSGPDKDRRTAGIYRLEEDGNTLTLCLPRPGENRPPAFTTRPNSRDTLMVLKRRRK
jgi:uncharacterized protein (TIGR03067 family)